MPPSLNDVEGRRIGGLDDIVDVGIGRKVVGWIARIVKNSWCKRAQPSGIDEEIIAESVATYGAARWPGGIRGIAV